MSTAPVEYEIPFEGSLSREDYVRALAMAEPMTLRISMIFKGLSAWSALLLIGYWFYRSDTGLDWFSYGQGLLVAVLYLLGHSFAGKEAVAWDGNPALREPYSGVLCEQGVQVNGNNFWRKTPWSEMTSWCGDEQMFLIRMPGFFYLFPMRHFASPEEWAAARAFVNEQLPYLAKVSTGGK